jgi:Flp pilus assembly pilin Flp
MRNFFLMDGPRVRFIPGRLGLQITLRKPPLADLLRFSIELCTVHRHVLETVMKRLVHRFFADESGTGAIEAGLAILVVAVVFMSAITGSGTEHAHSAAAAAR